MEDKEILVSGYEFSTGMVTNKDIVDLLNWAMEEYDGFFLDDDEFEYDGGTLKFDGEILYLHEDSGLYMESDRLLYKKGAENLPVVKVTYHGAYFLCNLKSLRQGLEPVYDFKNEYCDFSKNGYRLPTEAEWNAAYLQQKDLNIDFFELEWEFCWDKFKFNNHNRWKEDKDPYNLYFNKRFVCISRKGRRAFENNDVGYSNTGFRYVRSLPHSEQDSLGKEPRKKITHSIIPGSLLGLRSDGVSLMNFSLSYNLTIREVVGFGLGYFYFYSFDNAFEEETNIPLVFYSTDVNIGGLGIRYSPIIIGNRKIFAAGISVYFGLQVQGVFFLAVPVFFPYYAFTLDIYFLNFVIQAGIGDYPQGSDNNPSFQVGLGYSFNF